jgi:succinyl-CoA synthetase beta subunit
MNLHEYQSKQLFTNYGIPTASGRLARTLDEARAAARELGGSEWVVKAQVHAGGRGKAGGVKYVRGITELESFVNGLLGKRLVTHQTTAAGQPVNMVWLEAPCKIARELYLGAVVDRRAQRVAFMASPMGGVDIEEVAANHPDRIFTTTVDPVVGLQPYQCRQFAFDLGLRGAPAAALGKVMAGLYRLFVDKDLGLIEINPLVVTATDELLAVDAKLNVDDNALYRQKALADLRDPTQEDEKENRAQQFGLNYITLDGDIGCMVNGAGLAMATMDLIKLEGGMPANFLDVGGGTSAEKVAEAFKLLLSDPNVKAILVNIFGGIVRCDLIAEGIIKAVKEVGVKIPVVVRLEGTNVEKGRALLNGSGLAIIAANDLTEAARTAVRAARKIQ